MQGSFAIKYPDQAVLVPITEIDVTNRVRQDYGNLDDLADSIKDNGLIHPPVLNYEKRLIAGGRRFRAMTEKLGLTSIPVVFLETLDEAQLRILEAEENVRRLQPNWRERVKSIKLVHDHRLLTKLLNSEKWTQAETGALLGMARVSVTYALELARLLDTGDEEIAKCATVSDAIKLLVVRRENEINADLVRSTIPSNLNIQGNPAGLENLVIDLGARGGPTPDLDIDFFSSAPVVGAGGVGGLMARPAPETPQGVTSTLTTIPLSSMLFNVNSLEWLADHPASVDHIITDPPYGIEMTNLQQTNQGMDISSTAKEHDVESNLELIQRFIPLAYSTMRETGFCVMWCDVMHWEKLSTWAVDTGFKLQRWPLIWVKTHQCINQAAQFNFTKNYEIAMVLRKGSATLLSPQQSSVWTGSGQDEKDRFGHPFAKPTKLWSWVYSAIAMRGQTVLDPFSGSASSMVAAIQCGMKPLGLELNTDHHNRAVVNVSNFYKSLQPNVQFV